MPAAVTQQTGDTVVALSTILLCQPDDLSRKRLLIGFDHSLHGAGWNGADQSPSQARRSEQPGAACTWWAPSLRREERSTFPQTPPSRSGHPVSGGYSLPEPLLLFVQLLEPAGLTYLQTAIFTPPAVVALLRYAQIPAISNPSSLLRQAEPQSPATSQYSVPAYSSYVLSFLSFR